MNRRAWASPWAFRGFALAALVLHALLLFGSPELRGGADLLPHLRLIEQMGEVPALRTVYAPAYHVLGALTAPLSGLALFPKLFALVAAVVLIGGFRFFQRAAGLPDAASILFVCWPYAFSLSWCIPKVEAAGYGIAFFGLGLLARRRHAAVAVALLATFLLHTASALFFGIAAGVLALASRDARGVLALAVGTLLATPLLAAHLAAGCTLPEALLFSENDYLRATTQWSSAAVWDVIVLLASPIALVAAGLGAGTLWNGHRRVAIVCGVLAVLYLNELWLAPVETRTSLDLLRGLSALAFPVSVSGGVWLAKRPRLAPWLLALCGLWAVGAALLVVPRSCHVRPVALAELQDLEVARCKFRWSGPAIERGRAAAQPSSPLASVVGSAADGLVFVREGPSSRDLARARIRDGAVEPFLATAAREEAWPYWSAAGEKLVYQSRPVGARHYDLLLWTPRAREAHPLARSPRRDEGWPAWSPNGEELVFAFTGIDPPAGIRLVELRARGRSRLLATSDRDDLFYRPSFAPEGRPLLAERHRRDAPGSEVWLLDPGQAPRPLLREPHWTYQKPWFTRDGSSILLTRGPAEGGARDVVLAGAGGADLRVVASLPEADDHSARPSPRRDEFAFVSTRAGSRDLFLASLDGGEVRNLTASAALDEFIPRWSPDGERLVVTAWRAREREPGLEDLAELSILVLDRQGRELFQTPGYMPDWMPPWP